MKQFKNEAVVLFTKDELEKFTTDDNYIHVGFIVKNKIVIIDKTFDDSIGVKTIEGDIIILPLISDFIKLYTIINKMNNVANGGKVNTTIKEMTSAKSSINLGKIIITSVSDSEDSSDFKKLFMNPTDDAVKFFTPDWVSDNRPSDNFIEFIKSNFNEK
jgi:GTPase Era involved in 16S rRNA processing